MNKMTMETSTKKRKILLELAVTAVSLDTVQPIASMAKAKEISQVMDGMCFEG